MLTRIARLATGHPRAVLVATLLLVIVCGVFGASAQKHLKSGGFIPPGMESARANQFIADNFPGGNPNLIIAVTADGGVDSPAAAQAGDAVLADLAKHQDVVGAQSYWTIPRKDLANGLRSSDMRTGLVIATIKGNDTDAPNTAHKIAGEVDRSGGGVEVRTGGLTASFSDIQNQVGKDLLVAEGIAIPLSLIVLVLVFGSLVAAALPVGIGIFAIIVGLGILRALTSVVDVSVFAMNMLTALGLALAIDYSLFIVSRYREELGRGLDTRAAVIRSVQTAGRTVVFSALTVALSMTALLVFAPFFLKSFAYAGVAVIIMAAMAAVLILPACLMLLGDRINALDLRTPLLRLVGRSPHPVAPEDSRWYRVVVAVMRRAAPVAIIAIAGCLFLGSPFLHAHFGYPDDQVLNSSVSSREVGDMLRHDFGSNAGASAVVAMPNYQGSQEALGQYAAALSQVKGVPIVLSADGVYANGARLAAAPPQMSSSAGTYLSVLTKDDPYSTAGTEQQASLRAVPAPGEVLFAGPGAMNKDSLQAIQSRLPLALAIIAIATFIVLFLFTGSVVLPLKALLLNMLSLTATYGAMVWMFQEGHLHQLLGFTATGYINATMPILMFCIAFGMSMDYEVFLLSRVREEWLASDRTDAANTHAVAMGVARTGRIFTAAAVLMSIVFFAMATSKVSFIQLFGVGLALAVLADATVIRLLLAPALMRMLGTKNWWAPKPMAALHRRIGLEEEPVAAESDRTLADLTA